MTSEGNKTCSFQQKKIINKAEITKPGLSSDYSVYRPTPSLCGTEKRYPCSKNPTIGKQIALFEAGNF